MIILFILGILLGAVAVVFSLQNIEVVTVTFFDWHLTGSLSLILLSAIIVGMLIVLLIILPGSVGNYFKNRKLKKEITRLEEELRKQKEKTVFAKDISPKPEDIAKIEEGAIDHENNIH